MMPIRLFNGFHTRDSIRFPPTLPMPSITSTKDAPSSIAPRLSSQPTQDKSVLFQIRCQLWVISQEIASVYKYRTDVPVRKRVPPAFAESKY